MIVINEFEFFEEGGMVCALPFGREGGTAGEDLDDAVCMAADWLFETMKQEAIEGVVTADAEFGHKPEHGGIVIAVAVDFELSRVDAVSAAEAARILGVSPARVTQMCESGQLASWKDGSRRMVLRESVDTRLADKPRAGRPRTSTKQAPKNMGCAARTGIR